MSSEELYEEYVNYYTNLGKKLFDETVEWDEKEREYYLKSYWDWCSIMETAKMRGYARGLKKGFSERLEKIRAQRLQEDEEKQEILYAARNMKQEGMDMADIKELTGLSEEEIRQL